ncbi:MAG: selenocysteine-specific translation elongation factor [Rubrivivax sp.]|nr:selenocysteine-specific translation elongation factor [Rubrivivax sp.]
MIFGTAGHVDHGKTTLVRALTGVDTDRLPEEKSRGISIELGYAFIHAGGQGSGTQAGEGAGRRIGFIDVPGHERLVHTMVAGATGIDHALLLVAADDGVMPQTREHLAVLSLLGLSQGTVVVTKADRVDAARRAAVQAEAAALVQGTPLAASPVLAVSATSGQGIAALKARLVAAALAQPRTRDAQAGFRLAVDRVFTLAGTGTVVTGTVHAGRVAAGDELRLVPSGAGGGRSMRVRTVHAQNRPAAAALAGERCALALAGVARDEIERGQWLVAPPLAAAATSRFDARLTLWREEARALRSGTPVQVHVGAAGVPGSVVVLDAQTVAPGASAHVQLVLQRPLGAWHGDRVVLRDASATRTIAGGTVLDPFAPVRYRRTPGRLAELAALETPHLEDRCARVLAAAPLGLDWQRLAAAQGRASLPLPASEGQAPLRAGGWALAAGHAAAAREALRAALAAFHAHQPDEPGPEADRLRRLAVPRLPQALFRALLAALQADKRVVLRGPFVHLPEHGVRLSASEERIAQKVAPRLVQAGFEGAWVRDLARAGGESEALMRTTLARLARRGEFHQVVKDLYYPLATMATLAALARQVATANAGAVTAAAFRDATLLGRKRAIQLLEHFDRIGLTRRLGDAHRLRADSAALSAAPEGGSGPAAASAAARLRAA